MFRHAIHSPPFSLLVVALVSTGLMTAGAARAEDAHAGKLPVKNIVLFNSGVGFYEHLGQVEGNTQVDLKFNVRDINDLLKSMVLEDLDGGQISTVSYGSRDPITKTLKTFAIDLTNNPTLAELLAQVRGEQVEIDAPNKITGTIIGIERRRQRVGKDEVVEQDILNLLTDEGLRSVALETVGRIKLVNPELDAELRQALALLATSHATDKKTVSIEFLGEGNRRVRVGYIKESPVWKTSYRLALSGDGPPHLQGWAIVENTTDKDWQDVSLTLVSGRPISFVMDLYSPLYAPRPVVELDLYASLRPQVYNQDMADKERRFTAAATPEFAPQDATAKEEVDALAARRRPASRGQGGGMGGGGFGGGGLGVDLARGVRSVAEAGDVGEMFRYVIATPVTLARQRSAMLPIVNQSIEGKKVSIYNQRVHVKHPLNGLKLKNTSGLHLMQGPVTVFDDGIYAGDAKLADLPPGAERLVSYAMDLDVEVAPTSRGKPEELLSARLVKGTLFTTRKFARTHSFEVKNSGDESRSLLIEYPRNTSWKLLAPKKPAETTRDLYRFAVEAEPGKPVKLTIEEERVVEQRVAVTNLNDNAIRIYLRARSISDSVKEALQEVVRRKAQLAELAARRGRLTGTIQTIGKEQERIRRNMQQLQRNSDLYNRYVKKFTDQEDQVEQVRAEIETLTNEEVRQRKELDNFLMNLDMA